MFLFLYDIFFFFSSRRRHTRSLRDWSSDVCSSDLVASVHNALLAMVVDSLATLFPATPGGAGTKQGLIVFLFKGQAVSRTALLAFSVRSEERRVGKSVGLGGRVVSK